MIINKRVMKFLQIIRNVNIVAFIALLVTLWFSVDHWLIFVMVCISAAIIMGTFLACWGILTMLLEDVYGKNMQEGHPSDDNLSEP